MHVIALATGNPKMAEVGKKASRAWRRLTTVHIAVSNAIETALKAADLPPELWLRALDALERAAGGMRPFEVQATLGIEQPAVSRLLDRMHQAGSIERVACDDDRRGWRVSITDEGRQTLERMTETRRAALAEHFFDRLTEKQLKTLDEIFGDWLDARRPA